MIPSITTHTWIRNVVPILGIGLLVGILTWQFFPFNGWTTSTNAQIIFAHDAGQHKPYTFSLRHIPIVKQAALSNAASLEGYEGHHYFELKVKSNDQLTNVEDLLKKQYATDFESIWQAILFRQQSNFHLKIGSTQLPCALYHTLAPPIKGHGLTFYLVFKDTRVNNDAKATLPAEVTFHDDIFTQQDISFTFSYDDNTDRALAVHN